MVFLPIVVFLLAMLSLGATIAPTPPLFDGGSGAGTTYVVSPSGSGSTCSQGSPCSLDTGKSLASSPGDVVLLKNGVYPQQLRTSFGGSPNQHIIFRAENQYGAIIRTQADANFGRVYILHSYITIDGLTVDGQNIGHGIALANAGGISHVIIENCNIINSGRAGIKTWNTNAQDTDIIIRNNIVNTSGLEGNGNIVGSSIYFSRALSKQSAGQVRSIVYGNEFLNYTENCVDMKPPVTDAWFFDNLCHDWLPTAVNGGLTDGQILIYGVRNYAYRNKIWNIDENGPMISIQRIQPTTSQNLAYNNVMFSSPNLTLLYRVDYNASGVPQIFNNTAFGVGDDTAIFNNNGSANIQNNIGYNGGNNIPIQNVQSNWFVSAGNGNFALTANATQAIDQATSEPFSLRDFNLNAISGTARDYGAYEYQEFQLPPPIAQVDGGFVLRTDLSRIYVEITDPNGGVNVNPATGFTARVNGSLVTISNADCDSLGNGTAHCILTHNGVVDDVGDTITVSYSQATGNVLDGTGAELAESTNINMTNLYNKPFNSKVILSHNVPAGGNRSDLTKLFDDDIADPSSVSTPNQQSFFIEFDLKNAFEFSGVSISGDNEFNNQCTTYNLDHKTNLGDSYTNIISNQSCTSRALTETIFSPTSDRYWRFTFTSTSTGTEVFEIDGNPQVVGGVQYNLHAYRVHTVCSSENSVWASNVNGAFCSYAGDRFRLRTGIRVTGANSTSQLYPLYARLCNPTCGSYSAVTATSGPNNGIRLYDDCVLNQNDPTTNVFSLDGYTYRAGRIVEDSMEAANSITILQNEQTEMEYVLRVDRDNVSVGDIIEFQVRKQDGSPFEMYTATPTISIGQGMGTIVGGETSGTRQ